VASVGDVGSKGEFGCFASRIRFPMIAGMMAMAMDMKEMTIGLVRGMKESPPRSRHTSEVQRRKR